MTGIELIQKVTEQLDCKGEKFDRIYRAFEGDLRVISKMGIREKRYTVKFENEYPYIIEM